MNAPDVIETEKSGDRWSIAMRLAGAAAVVAATVAYALIRFMHVGAVPLLALGTLFGLAVGTRLPAGAPRVLHPRPSLDDELEALLGQHDES